MPAAKKLFKQRATTISPFQGEKKPQVADNAATGVSAAVATSLYKPVMIRQKGKTPYWDFSDVPPPPGYKAPTVIQDMNFAEKIYHMLSNPECVHFITWMSHGRAFKVLVPQLFEIHVCPRYFGYKRYALFRRDLEEHGFEYIASGRDRNCRWKMAAGDERPLVAAEFTLIPLFEFVVDRLLPRMFAATSFPSLQTHQIPQATRTKTCRRRRGGCQQDPTCSIPSASKQPNVCSIGSVYSIRSSQASSAIGKCKRGGYRGALEGSCFCQCNHGASSRAKGCRPLCDPIVQRPWCFQHF